MKDAAGPSSGTAKRGSLQFISDYLGETHVQYPSTPMMAGRARLAHKCPLMPGEILSWAAAYPEPKAAHLPSQLPPRRSTAGFTRNQSRWENTNFCALCNSAKLLLLLLLISTRWHQWGYFPFLHPLPLSILPWIWFLSPEHTVQVLS